MTAYVSHCSARCTVGFSPAQVLASIRAGISKYAESSVFFFPNYFPIVSFLEESEFPHLERPEGYADTSAYWRMTQLAAAALRDLGGAAGLGGQPMPIFVGLPPREDQDSLLDDEAWLGLLGQLSGIAVSVEKSQCFRTGRASVFQAMARALKGFESGEFSSCVVGGTDSYLGLRRLDQLYRDKRVLHENSMGGFAPGEGAGFFLLSKSPQSGSQLKVCGLGVVEDPGHMSGDAPHTGEGLSNSIERMRRLFPVPKVAQVWTGMNGEHFFGKEWGVATLRHSDFIDAEAQVNHPAEYFGDVGAATGALLVGLAAQRERRDLGSRLVWSSSDREAVGACVLELIG